jgi:hypothetical protein
MKKVFLFAVLATVMVACGGKGVQSEGTDSVAVDSVQVDSLAVPTEDTLEGAGAAASEEVAEPVSEQPVK